MTPEILVIQASASTVADEGDIINPNLLTARLPRTHNADAIAIKLNFLCKKSSRHNSHKGFLSRCVQKKLAPKGLDFSLEPTIGNYGQEFIDNL